MSLKSAPPIENPLEIVVRDSNEPCPYLDSHIARMPIRLPTRRLYADEFDARLDAGDRRCGVFLYRTRCPSCKACEPMRIEVDAFRPSRGQRRVERKGDKQIRLELGDPVVNEQRVELYNRHKRLRGLAVDRDDSDQVSYREFLADSCCDTFEIAYYFDDRLIGVAICDRGQHSVSAVYFYFDPHFSHLSPGVYSILKQIQLCREWGMRYLYLGLYIAASKHMSYKANYLPHQRLIDGCWHHFD